MNTLEALYDNFIENHKDSKEAQKAIDLCDGATSADESNAIFDTIALGLNAERKSAFYAGFKAAVQLFTESMLVEDGGKV